MNRFWRASEEGSGQGILGRIPALIGGRESVAARSPDTAESLLLMKNFEESLQGWFWSTDASGHVTYLTNSVAQIFNGPYQSLRDVRFADLFSSADDDINGRRTLPFLLAKQSTFERLTLRAAAVGDERCWFVSGCPQFDQTGCFTGYRGSAVDITEQRNSSRRASQLAKYDSLTGLPNRHRMSEALASSLLAAEHQKRPCALMLIDLDRFKQVNDTLGHPAGDALLKQVAERLLRIVGDRETVFRPGGDEFQIILNNCEDRGIIGDMAADIIGTLSQPYSIDGSRCSIGASIGIAVGPVDGGTRDDLIRSADLALYASKTSGRGRFRFFSSDLLKVAEDRRILEEDLRDALAKGEMKLTYQPIINATTNCMTGVEALLRWQHPERGAISPATFIPIAEEANLIGRIGEWVLRKACEDAASWPGDLRVAVNVSPVQFMDETLPSIVVSALAGSGLAPDRLELEITEGVFLAETSETDTMFAALKEVGVRLALDDFGTGYSSLGYLRTAPFDKIKIDQTFVREATLPGSRNSAIIAAIVALAEALDMETTAEGIEFMDQLNLVRGLRVSHVQGWVYSKAISSDELIKRLEDGDWILQPAGPARQRSDRQAMYRKVGVIDGRSHKTVLIRNLSETGALIEGLADVCAGTLIVVDFGDGQLAFARVSRAHGGQHGIAFEQPLVSDGNGGLCTSRRVSPYLLHTMGLAATDGSATSADQLFSTNLLEELAEKLGLTLAPQVQVQQVAVPQPDTQAPRAQDVVPTFREMSARYLENLAGDEPKRESAKRDLRNHILPRFGQLRLDQVSRADVFAWLAAKMEVEDHPSGTDNRLHSVLHQMWSLAVKLGLPGAEQNPLEEHAWLKRMGGPDDGLTLAEGKELIIAARTSQNRQLKYVVALLMLTGARQGDLLRARWDDIDLASGLWRIPISDCGKVREVQLTPGATDLLGELPRWDGCPHLLPNPLTKKPYKSIMKSWEVAKLRAGLPYLEIEDLRRFEVRDAASEAAICRCVREGAGDPGSAAQASIPLPPLPST